MEKSQTLFHDVNFQRFISTTTSLSLSLRFLHWSLFLVFPLTTPNVSYFANVSLCKSQDSLPNHVIINYRNRQRRFSWWFYKSLGMNVCVVILIRKLHNVYVKYRCYAYIVLVSFCRFTSVEVAHTHMLHKCIWFMDISTMSIYSLHNESTIIMKTFPDESFHSRNREELDMPCNLVIIMVIIIITLSSLCEFALSLINILCHHFEGNLSHSEHTHTYT